MSMTKPAKSNLTHSARQSFMSMLTGIATKLSRVVRQKSVSMRRLSKRMSQHNHLTYACLT